MPKLEDSAIGNGPRTDFEERADQLSAGELETETVVQDVFDQIQRELIARGLVLLEGPRGCGKTHMMRYVELVCSSQTDKPFAVYVSFNRYLRLEPLLSMRSDALNLFQAWVLALLARAVVTKLDELVPDAGLDLHHILGIDREALEGLIGRLERGQQPNEDEESTAEALRVDAVLDLVRRAAAACGRRRTVLLLDDAALTLSRDLLIEFFDIVRVLKTHDVSPKASVYPGTTEYGPRFHADHEGRRVTAWLPVDQPNYVEVMRRIAEVRFQGMATVPADVDRVLMYAAFGVPRAYLTLLRQWVTGAGTSQSLLNEIVREHRDARLNEFRSLAAKLPTLATLVRAGASLFEEAAKLLAAQNRDLADANEKQLLLGVPSSDLDAMATRMLSLLVEAGLLRQESTVSHGENRTYVRLMPHVGALIALRAFEKGQGGGAKRIVEGMERRSTKHPLRRSLRNLLGEQLGGGLHLDEPPCASCGTRRLSPNQKFCHNCGNKLLDDSTFERCMRLSIDEVPGLSDFKRSSLREQGLTTIGEVVGSADPGTTIRRARGMGAKRTAQAIDAVHGYVDEFLN